MAEKRTLDEVEAKASEAAAGHRERLGEVARGVEQRYQRVAEEMKREAERASQAAKQKMEGAARQLRQGYAQASKTAGTVAEDVADFVRDNPGKSLVIAAAAGFLVGLLFRRSVDD